MQNVGGDPSERQVDREVEHSPALQKNPLVYRYRIQSSRRRESTRRWMCGGARAEERGTRDNAKCTISLGPTLAILFVATLMRALHILTNNGPSNGPSKCHGRPADNEGRCEFCGQFANIPYDVCRFCRAAPSYHHGRCCRQKPAPRPSRPRARRRESMRRWLCGARAEERSYDGVNVL